MNNAGQVSDKRLTSGVSTYIATVCIRVQETPGRKAWVRAR